jgi:hypothetical protein
MAKLIEAYSRNTGLEIKKPFLLEKFYPLEFDKYITIQSGSGMGAKNYSYWQEVILQINPVLAANNIRIVLLGATEDQGLNGVVDLRGKTDIHQSNYIIKRSLLHIGNDSCLAHIAGANNIPLISLYGSTSIENHSPYWYNKEKTIFIESHRFGRNPTFAAQEQYKTIDLIRPEQVVNSVFKLLGIEEWSKKDTYYIGNSFQNVIVEYVPNCNFTIKGAENTPVVLRLDFHYEIKGLLQLVQQNIKFNVITNKPIDINLLKQTKNNINNLTIEVCDDITVEYIKQLKNSGIKFVLFTDEKDKDKVSKLRFKFFGISKIEQLQKTTLDDFKNKSNLYRNQKEFVAELSDLKFNTNKVLFGNGKLYPSKIHFKKDVSFNLGESAQIIDHELFWEDLEYNYFYKDAK